MFYQLTKTILRMLGYGSIFYEIVHGKSFIFERVNLLYEYLYFFPFLD